MMIIHMGLNTTPAWVNEAEVVFRRLQNKDYAGAQAWREECAQAKELRNQIEEAVEQYGKVSLDWSCTGASLFEMLALQWSKAMPNYHFEIGQYYCVVTKTPATN